MTDSIRIGVISDTHGYLDPLVLSVFAGVDHIIHAGDVMDPATLAALEGIAAVTAVAGNMDAGKLGRLPREVAGEVAGVRFVVGHKRKRLLKRLALGKIEGCLARRAARPRGVRARPYSRRRMGRRYRVPQPGHGFVSPRGGRRSHRRGGRQGGVGAERAVRPAEPVNRGFLRLKEPGLLPRV